jgi:integrase
VYKTDLVQAWLDSVALSHSGAENTETLYRYNFGCFLKFINAATEDIQKDYNELPERQFRQKYAQALRAWSSQLMRQDYTQGTISAFMGAAKSFFKYSDFPLSFVPAVQRRVVFHNRDIDKAEILQVLGMSTPREKAFYAIMAQSGLRPSTLCMLKLKHLEPDFSQGKNPVMVKVPEDLAKGKYHEYFTFIGEDAARLLKDYLNTRRNLSGESFVFVNQGSEDPMIYNTVSSMFRKAVRLLRDKGVMSYEQKKRDRPAEIRLYTLRKWFRKQAIQAGFENVEFWMGHTGPGVDSAYRPKDPEFYRKIYTEKAMPFLRLESSTPTETEKQIEELRNENATLKLRLNHVAASTEGLEKLLKRVEELEKKLKAENE